MKQVTFVPRNHQPTNTRAWTPDSQWLVFNVRLSGTSFTGETIEQVNVDSGTMETVYHAAQSVRAGVVTMYPIQERYVFIRGPERPDAWWQYDFHHCCGVVAFRGAAESLDAMDIIAPYTPGALRGGNHAHVYSPNGQFVSLTYNDHVPHERDPALDLRNVGVVAPYGPATPQGKHPREYSGSHWCMLVSHTAPTPVSGSDEINRAHEEEWVGNHVLAFIGDTLAENGDKVPELFIVDLPQDEAGWKQPGGAPLAGTTTTMPAPPTGVSQRRSTFTHHRRYPGLVSVPCHWVCANPQATVIAFLMCDDAGVAQLRLISPQEGEPCQLTYRASGIQPAPSWYPSGEWLGFVLEDRIVYCHAGTGDITFLTKVYTHASLADATISSPGGKQIVWMEEVDGYHQLWVTRTGR